jgi:Uma2 family endonuclease
MTDTVAPIEELDVDEERFVFDDADWVFYELVLKRVGDRRVFVTFDGERLEVMSPSLQHDKLAERLGQLARLVMVERRMAFESAGSFTLKKRRANRGLEADRCLYIQHVSAVLGKRKIDLRKGPPPDLAIEIEISRRLLDRIDIYGRLGVPEVWCCDGRRLRVLRLEEGTTCKEVPRSPTFPDLPPEEMHRLLELAWEMDELAWTDAVRQWIREHLRSPGRR